MENGDGAVYGKTAPRIWLIHWPVKIKGYRLCEKCPEHRSRCTYDNVRTVLWNRVVCIDALIKYRSRGVEEDRQRGREGVKGRKQIHWHTTQDDTRRLIADPARGHQQPPVHRVVHWHQNHCQTAAIQAQPAAQVAGSPGGADDRTVVGHGQGKAVVVGSARAQNASEMGAQTQVVRV